MARSLTIKLPEMPRPLRSRKVLLVILAILIIVAALFWKDIYSYAVYRDPQEREMQRLVLDVRSQAVLPGKEAPGLATVTDVSKLNRGGVLQDAKDGDKVLLYYKAARAILYRPGVSKVVAIGPLILDASASQVRDAKIVVRNGSGNADTASDALKLMKERYSEATLSGIEPASRSDYPNTIVIDLSKDGKKSELSNAIIELLGARKGIVPQGEPKPDADIMIIVGNDFGKQ